MTIPVTPDHFLVMNIFKGTSGLPEDVFVNNFIFRNTDDSGGLSGAAELRAADAVRDFFVTNAPAVDGDAVPAETLATYISSVVSGWEQKVYDLGDPPGGRAPTTYDRLAELPSGRTGVSLPPEIAAVLSLQTPIIGKRGKGRIYLGPLRLATVVDSAGEPPTFTPAFVARVRAQAAKLALGNGRDMEWRVWSTTRGETARVIGGSMDNACDVQRRRGIKATFRKTFGTITPTVPPT